MQPLSFLRVLYNPLCYLIYHWVLCNPLSHFWVLCNPQVLCNLSYHYQVLCNLLFFISGIVKPVFYIMGYYVTFPWFYVTYRIIAHYEAAIICFSLVLEYLTTYCFHIGYCLTIFYIMGFRQPFSDSTLPVSYRSITRQLSSVCSSTII